MPRITDFADLFQDLNCARGVLTSAFQLPARTLLVDSSGSRVLQENDFHSVELIPWNIEAQNAVHALFRVGPWDHVVRVHSREVFQEMNGRFIREGIELGAVVAEEGVFRTHAFPGAKLYGLNWQFVRQEQKAAISLWAMMALSTTAALCLRNELGRAFVVKLDEVFTFEVGSTTLRDKPTPAITHRPLTVWEHLIGDDDDLG